MCLLYTLKEGRIILLIPCPDLSVPTFGTTMTFLVLTVLLNLTKKRLIYLIRIISRSGTYEDMNDKHE